MSRKPKSKVSRTQRHKVNKQIAKEQKASRQPSSNKWNYFFLGVASIGILFGYASLIAEWNTLIFILTIALSMFWFFSFKKYILKK